MGSLFSTQKQKSYQSNSVSLPAWMSDDLQGLSQGAISNSTNPYPTWQGPASIGMTPEQQQAEQQTAGIAGYQPTTVSTTGLPGMDLSGYLNPYTQNVIDTSNAQIDRATQQSQQQASGQAALAGAFGGDRAAVEQATLASQGNLNKAQVDANLYNQNFINAQQQAQTDLGRQLTADTTNAGLGLQGAQLDLSAANQLFGQGAVDQGYQQAGLSFEQNQNLQQATWPMQQLQAASGIVTGSAPLFATQNTVATTPGPSMFAQLLGLGASAGGAAMGGGGLASGGIADYAHGGQVIEGEFEEVPETGWMPHEVRLVVARLRPGQYNAGGEVIDGLPTDYPEPEVPQFAPLFRLPQVLPSDPEGMGIEGQAMANSALSRRIRRNPTAAANDAQPLPSRALDFVPAQGFGDEPAGIAAAVPTAPAPAPAPDGIDQAVPPAPTAAEPPAPGAPLPLPPPPASFPTMAPRPMLRRAAGATLAPAMPGDDPNAHLPQGIAAMAKPAAAPGFAGGDEVSKPSGNTEEDDGGGILGWARRHLVPDRNPELGNFLLSTGAGIMASRSPFPLVAVGEGLQAGIAARRQYQTQQAQQQERKATYLERRDERLTRAEDRDLDRAARTESQRQALEQRREQAQQASTLRLQLAQLQHSGQGASGEARDMANRLRMLEIENRQAASQEAQAARREREARGVQDSANQEENRLRDDLRAEAMAQRPINRQLTELTGHATPDPLTADQVRQINQAARERVAELHPRSQQARSWASEVLPRERWESIKGLNASDLEAAFVRNGVPEPERQRIRRAADILRHQQ